MVIKLYFIDITRFKSISYGAIVVVVAFSNRHLQNELQIATNVADCNPHLQFPPSAIIFLTT